MQKKLFRILPLALTVLTVSACAKKATETSAPAEVPAAVTAPAPAAETPPAAADASLNGNWSGMAEPDLPIDLTVEGNQITYFYANYAGRNGTCSFNGAFSNDVPGVINGKSFNAHGKTDNGPMEFNASGTFTSATEVSGTIEWKGNSGACGDFNIKANWKATKKAE